MTTLSLTPPLASRAQSLPASAPEPARESTAQATIQDAYQATRKDRSDIGWVDVGRGVVGSVTGAVILTAANTANAALQAPLLTGQAWKALATNETHGPWVKGGMALLAPLAAGLGVAATAIGSLGYGLYQGFVDGVHRGVGGAVEGASQVVKTFHREGLDGMRRGIKDFGEAKLEPGEKRFDVSPVRAGVGVVGGVGAAAYGAVRAGWTTAKHTPQAFLIGNAMIHRSDMSTPLQFASHALSAPLAVLAAPLGTLAGAGVGLVLGASEGYTKGLTHSFQKAHELANFYEEKASNLLQEAADDLVRG